MHIGITCPALDGIHLHSIPTDLVRFSVKGLVYSIPLGAVSLLICRLASTGIEWLSCRPHAPHPRVFQVVPIKFEPGPRGPE